MTQTRPSDVELMALADGALTPADAARVSAAVAGDPALAEKVEMYRQTRRLVQEARGALDAEPVPDALRRSIEAMIAASETKPAPPENVLAFRPKPAAPPQPQQAQRSQRPWAMPIAASLIALVGGVVGYMAAKDPAGGEASAIAAVGQPLPAAVATVLASTASGAEAALPDGRMRVIASVRSKAGTLCREFEIDSSAGQTMVGIGCRDNGSWRLDIAVAAPPASDGFAPASSLDAIDSYLGMIEAGEPLTPEDEAKALSSAN